MFENDQWIHVNTPEDLRPILNEPMQMYTVLSKFGRILCVYPAFVRFHPNGNIKEMGFHSCCSGTQGCIYSECTPILAYKPINIDQDLLDTVNSTKKGQNSVLSRAYSQKYPCRRL